MAALNERGTRLVLRGDTSAVYTPPLNGGPGHLLFVRGRTLMAQSFDPDRIQLVGEPFPVAPDVTFSFLDGPSFSSSANGVLAFRQKPAVQLAWLDRKGRHLGFIGEPGRYRSVSLSPDERWVAVDGEDPQTGILDLWLMELARNALERFTFAPGSDYNPIWSPDGKHIVFTSTRGGFPTSYRKPARGAGREEPLLATGRPAIPHSWSPDGQHIAYVQMNPSTGDDLWIMPLADGSKPFPFLQSEFSEIQPEFSPDGRWLAYTSDESSRFEVYVRPFLGAAKRRDAKWQISTNGGYEPHWGRNGRELFYLAVDGTLMAAEVVSDSEGFRIGVAQPLFQTRTHGNVSGQSHDVSADGRRFLIRTLAEDDASASISLIVNWPGKAKR